MNKGPRRITRIEDSGTKRELEKEDLKVPFSSLEPKVVPHTVDPNLSLSELQHLQKVLQSEIKRGAHPGETNYLSNQDQAFANLKAVEAKIDILESHALFHSLHEENQKQRDKLLSDYGIKKEEYTPPPHDPTRPGYRDDNDEFQTATQNAEGKGWGKYSNRESPLGTGLGSVANPDETIIDWIKSEVPSKSHTINPRKNIPKKK